MKTEYKFGQYCTPLSRSDSKYFFVSVISNAINQDLKVNKKYMKDYDKHKELSHLQYWDGQYQKSLYGWAISEKFLVYGFKWVENTSQGFIENYNEDSDEGYFPKVDV